MTFHLYLSSVEWEQIASQRLDEHFRSREFHGVRVGVKTNTAGSARIITCELQYLGNVNKQSYVLVDGVVTYSSIDGNQEYQFDDDWGAIVLLMSNCAHEWLENLKKAR